MSKKMLQRKVRKYLKFIIIFQAKSARVVEKTPPAPKYRRPFASANAPKIPSKSPLMLKSIKEAQKMQQLRSTPIVKALPITTTLKKPGKK